MKWKNYTIVPALLGIEPNGRIQPLQPQYQEPLYSHRVKILRALKPAEAWTRPNMQGAERSDQSLENFIASQIDM